MLFSMEMYVGSFLLNLHLPFEPIKMIVIHSLAKKNPNNHRHQLRTNMMKKIVVRMDRGCGISAKVFSGKHWAVQAGGWYLVAHMTSPQKAATAHNATASRCFCNCSSHLSHPFQMSFSIGFMNFFIALVKKKCSLLLVLTF
jgi:hypothetical protein